jgi:hypothetical protein
VVCGLATLTGQEGRRVNVVVTSSLLDQGVVSRTRVCKGPIPALNSAVSS